MVQIALGFVAFVAVDGGGAMLLHRLLHGRF